MSDKELRDNSKPTKYIAVSDGYKRNIRVTNIKGAERLMQRMFLQVQDGRISTKVGKDVIQMAKDFIYAIKSGKLESEIEEIKTQLKIGKK